jgi:antitoxin component YwqK of YwqJK toxin-antitoxin module
LDELIIPESQINLPSDYLIDFSNFHVDLPSSNYDSFFPRDPNPYSVHYPNEWTYSISHFNPWTTPCGENHHGNGILSSRCECNTKDILHGKSIYWDNRGLISAVYTYRNGKIYMHKSYTNGEINAISYYRYDNKGYQVKHGKCIGYEWNRKNIIN